MKFYMFNLQKCFIALYSHYWSPRFRSLYLYYFGKLVFYNIKISTEKFLFHNAEKV